MAVKEKLQEYALVAEIIGGIGIIASLIFVGFQLEQNTLSTELNAYENFRQDYVELQSNIITNPQFASILSKSYAGQDLTPEEVVQLDAYAFSLFTLGDSSYKKYSRSVISEDELLDALSLIRYMMTRSPFIYEAWGRIGTPALMDPEYIDYLNNYLSYSKIK